MLAELHVVFESVLVFVGVFWWSRHAYFLCPWSVQTRYTTHT